MKIASNEEKGLRTLEQLTNIRPFLKTSKARTVSKQRKKKQLDAKEYWNQTTEMHQLVQRLLTWGQVLETQEHIHTLLVTTSLWHWCGSVTCSHKMTLRASTPIPKYLTPFLIDLTASERDWTDKPGKRKLAFGKSGLHKYISSTQLKILWCCPRQNSTPHKSCDWSWIKKSLHIFHPPTSELTTHLCDHRGSGSVMLPVQTLSAEGCW